MKIAITGNIACGKSALMAELIELGEKCIDCDDIAKSVYDMPIVKKELKRSFGTAEQKEIAKIVFKDYEKRKILESILQPRILRKLKKELASLKRNETIFVEAPLLYEGSIENLFDYVVVVRASRKKQMERLIKRGYSKEEAILRIRSQMPLYQKIKKANFVVNGDKSKKQLKRIAREIIAKVRS
ncbi:MAG: dephospho-CoA kinase [Candidatus Diapherotrites archaeon]|nr:dephospho-CoA kinase [Candidatus Diapherotrites archaeon]